MKDELILTVVNLKPELHVELHGGDNNFTFINNELRVVDASMLSPEGVLLELKIFDSETKTLVGQQQVKLKVVMTTEHDEKMKQINLNNLLMTRVDVANSGKPEVLKALVEFKFFKNNYPSLT